MRRFWTRRYAAWGACLLAGVTVQASAQDGDWASAPIPAGPSFASAFPAPQVPAPQPPVQRTPSAPADPQSAAVAEAFETVPVASRPAPPLYLAAPHAASSANLIDARPIPVRRDAGTSLDALVGEAPAPRPSEPSLLPGDLRAEDLQFSDVVPSNQVWARAVSQPAAGIPTPAGAPAADPTAGLLETESAGMLQSTGPGPGDALSSSPQAYVQAASVCDRLDGWYAEAGAIFLQRTGASSKVLSIDGTTNLVAADAHDFHFPYASMPMVTIGYRAANGARWETTGYGITKWSEGISGVPDASGGFPFLNIPYLVGPGSFFVSPQATSQEIGYTSQLVNLESNVFWRTGDVLGRRTNLMFGGRMIHVNENLTMENFSPVSVDTYDVNTSNTILALQFGGEIFADRMYDCLTLSAAAKGGMGINFLSQKSDIYTNDAFALTPNINSGSAEDACLSSIAEFSLRADLELRRNATLRLGYHVIYLSGLALAPDQLDFTTMPGVSQRGLDENGNMVLQGPSVSLNFKF